MFRLVHCNKCFYGKCFNRSRSCFNSSRRFSTSSNTIPLCISDVFFDYTVAPCFDKCKKLSRSLSNDLNNVFKADFNQSSSMRMYSESHLPLPYELRFEQVHQTLGGRLGSIAFDIVCMKSHNCCIFIRFENKCLLLRFHVDSIALRSFLLSVVPFQIARPI